MSSQGLWRDGERPSIAPLASRIAGADGPALQQCVGHSPWAVEAVPRRLARQGVERLHNSDVWIIDETAFPKEGVPSVGVARQYCGPLGQVANCRVAVRWNGRRAEASGLLNGRLYRPKARIGKPHRAAHVKRPPGIPYRRKTAVAEEPIDQGRRGAVPARPLVADAFDGKDFGVRHALQPRQVVYVVEVKPRTSVWTEDPHLPWPPPKKTGCPRPYPPLKALPRPRHLQLVAPQLPAAAWQHVTWRQGRRGPQRSRFGVIHVWAAHGWRMPQHPPRVAEWQLVAWPQDALEPVKDWLAYFASQPPDVRRVGRIELDDRALQEASGLDHDAGRHGLGWHHYVCLVHVAQACLRSEQAQLKKTAGVTLPLVRRYLHAVLMRLIGCCPRCHSQFEDSS